MKISEELNIANSYFQEMKLELRHYQSDPQGQSGLKLTRVKFTQLQIICPLVIFFTVKGDCIYMTATVSASSEILL